MQAERADQATPKQWKRFLSNACNKTDLISFFAKHWRESTGFSDKLADGHQVYVTVGNTAFKLSRPGPTETTLTAADVPDLYCTQEEADTRLLLHASHAFAAGLRTAVITSPDTDVAVLAIALTQHLNGQVIFKTGTKQRTRLVDVKRIADKLGPTISSALLGLHSFTGM